MKRVVVTGATGFVGEATLPYLVERGYEVHGVSRTKPDIPGGVTWHPVDLFDRSSMQSLFDDLTPSHLLHLAWVTSPGRYLSTAENLDWMEATIFLVRSFATAGGERVVVTGTCLEYDLGPGRLNEISTPLRPTTVYGVTKHALHMALSAAAPQLGVSLAWARLFHLYGPRERAERLVPTVTLSLLKGEKASVSSGQQQRDYLHVADAAAAIATLLDSSVEGPVNVGSGKATSVREIVSRIGEILDSPELIDWGGARRDDQAVPLIVADTRRMQNEVGWRSTVELEEGLRRTVDWWRQQVGVP